MGRRALGTDNRAVPSVSAGLPLNTIAQFRRLYIFFTTLDQ